MQIILLEKLKFKDNLADLGPGLRYVGEDNFFV